MKRERAAASALYFACDRDDRCFDVALGAQHLGRNKASGTQPLDLLLIMIKCSQRYYIIFFFIIDYYRNL